jgi:hypothetical protein
MARPEQAEASRGKVPERIMRRKEVTQGAVFWLNSVTHLGEINYHKRVKVSRGPYESNEYSILNDLVDLQVLDVFGEPTEDLFVFSLTGLGIRSRRNPRLRTSIWLEHYVEPKSP